VRAYQVPVWRFVVHLLSDPSVADDVTQETFLRVYQRIGTYRFECRFTTWVFQIARNAGIDAGRAATRRRRLEQSPLTPGPPSDPVGRAEIEAALRALPPKLREAIVVIEVFGFRYREAALVLGVPAGTLKSRTFRARELLTAWYADEREAHDAM
jgi:RNA polymerase sigma-70 factor (ECF subfamily)